MLFDKNVSAFVCSSNISGQFLKLKCQVLDKDLPNFAIFYSRYYFPNTKSIFESKGVLQMQNGISVTESHKNVALETFKRHCPWSLVKVSSLSFDCSLFWGRHSESSSPSRSVLIPSTFLSSLTASKFLFFGFPQTCFNQYILNLSSEHVQIISGWPLKLYLSVIRLVLFLSWSYSS